MKLALDDSRTFEGRSFGAEREARGEVVFNTGLTGYVEALTDPSYHGQILVLTYPLQGNYGVPAGPFESNRVHVAGLVVSHYSDEPSHRASVQSLAAWLKAHDVPAIEGVDTRALTRHLREHGTMSGMLLARATEAKSATVHGVDMTKVAELVAPKETTRTPSKNADAPRILVIDTGAKESILRSLERRGASVIRAPYHAPWESHLDEVDGVLLTNGPGDPTDLGPLVIRIRALLGRGLPVFGICLGHQLLALAAGASTYKMKYGHRSQNQPVQDLVTGRAYVTSQNHGYAVDPATLSREWEPWFVNLNDGTNEGIRHGYRPFRSAQFHPEGAAGPHDTAYLFDDFLAMVLEMRRPHEGDRQKLLARSA
jgi:carbamoyl-phosphate synthase small subunit